MENPWHDATSLYQATEPRLQYCGATLKIHGATMFSFINNWRHDFIHIRSQDSITTVPNKKSMTRCHSHSSTHGATLRRDNVALIKSQCHLTEHLQGLNPSTSQENERM
jgi:hypothetical protein